MQLNLKFEVEVLCNTLSLEMKVRANSVTSPCFFLFFFFSFFLGL